MNRFNLSPTFSEQLDVEHASRILLLQSFGQNNGSSLNANHIPSDPDTVNATTNFLAYALADEETFANAFPDEFVRHCPSIYGERLPGLRPTHNNAWSRVSPGEATPQEQRNYIRQLLVSCARIMSKMVSRTQINHAAVTDPSSLPSLHGLAQVTGDICRLFDSERISYAHGVIAAQ